MFNKSLLLAAGLTVGAFASSAHAAVEIQFWHALGGALGEELKAITDEFNASQTDWKVNAVYKGNYTETMTAAIAAYRAKQPPHIVQVFEVGTATMMAAAGAVYPIHELMAKSGETFSEDKFVPAVASYYTTPEGKMLSMPFNSSTPVMYYNKDAFKKAGLDPEKPPQTWPELIEMTKTMMSSGATQCGFTTGWQSWVQLEAFSAWHNVPFATKENGFGGLDAELAFNKGPALRHIQNMSEWTKDNTFKYGGRRGDPNPLFINGECGILFNSSAYYNGFKKSINFDWGVAELPYYPDVEGAPQNTIIGGATFWVLRGNKDEEYNGVAKYMSFVSNPEIQAKWHQNTGYVPVTTAAYEATKKTDYYQQNPGSDVAIMQLSKNEPTENSKGVRLGNFVQIRDLINDELENVWAGKKTAQQALDDAVSAGNRLLRQFEKAN